MNVQQGFKCDNPECRAQYSSGEVTEEYAVYIGDDLDPDSIGILVTARGRVTNRWADGTVGISEQQREFAGEETEAQCLLCHESVSWQLWPEDETDE